MEPRYNEGPNLVRYNEVSSKFFFIFVTIIGVKKIVRYIEEFVI